MTQYENTCHNCLGEQCDIKTCGRSGAYRKLHEAKSVDDECKRLREELASFLEE